MSISSKDRLIDDQPLHDQPFHNQPLHNQSWEDHSSDDQSLHNQFVEYGKNAKQWLRKCALLLPEIERRKIWKKRGFESIYVYAAKIAGMSRWSVQDALRIVEKAEGKPAIQKLIEERGVNAARPIVTIATPETEVFWAQKARMMSKNTLETYIREYKSQQKLSEKSKQENGTGTTCKAELTSQGASSFTEQKISITMDLHPDLAAELEKLKGDNGGRNNNKKNDWNMLMQELLDLRKKTLEQQKPQPVTTESRHIPENIKQFVLAKTRGHCAYPRCTKEYDILHHLDRFALTKTHDPDRIVPLCTAHERLAHHSLIGNEDQQPQSWHMLEKPIWWDKKYMIDQRVMEYRKP